MTIFEPLPPADSFPKFLLMGLAVSATTWLAICLFVTFILVPDDVRSPVLHGTSAKWPTVVNATGIDNPARAALPL